MKMERNAKWIVFVWVLLIVFLLPVDSHSENECYTNNPPPAKFWYCNWFNRVYFDHDSYDDVTANPLVIPPCSGTYEVTVTDCNNFAGVPITNCRMYSYPYPNTTAYCWSMSMVYNTRTYFQNYDACDDQTLKRFRWCRGMAGAVEVEVKAVAGTGATDGCAGSIKYWIDNGTYINVPGAPYIGPIGSGMRYLDDGDCE